MRKVILTISREYGSGGRLIGEKAAELMGVPFYNHNLIDMVAHETGLSANYIREWEERVSSPRIWGLPVPSRSGAAGAIAAVASMNYYSSENEMFKAQSGIIRELANKGSCVIVGRCSDYILRNDPACLRVFLYADRAIRVQRVLTEYGAEDEAEAARRVRAIDRGRAAYYKKYADHTWGSCHNYHLSLDSGTLGVERCAQLLAQIASDFSREI